jgi:Ca2+-binding EF-hand superfamily protein
MVQMVRDHFGRMDANKDGSITTAEIGESHVSMSRDFDHFKDRGHAMAMGDPNSAFDRLDTDKNGAISREEFAKAREERIERRVVVRDERQKAREGAKDGQEARQAVRLYRGGAFGGRMIVMADGNKDGRITLAEAEAMALQHFDQMDTNKDGQVTREERRAGRRIFFERKIEEKKTDS